MPVKPLGSKMLAICRRYKTNFILQGQTALKATAVAFPKITSACDISGRPLSSFEEACVCLSLDDLAPKVGGITARALPGAWPRSPLVSLA